MAEWFKATVLKTVELKGSVGSNPSSSAMAHASDETSLMRDASGARVLVVDDDAVYRNILEELLKSAPRRPN